MPYIQMQYQLNLLEFSYAKSNIKIHNIVGTLKMGKSLSVEKIFCKFEI